MYSRTELANRFCEKHKIDFATLWTKLNKILDDKKVGNIVPAIIVNQLLDAK